MTQAWFYSFVAVLIVSLVSFVGVLTVGLSKKFLEKILLFLVSFAAGSLLGGVFFHLFPEAVEEAGEFTLEISLYVLGGIVIFFVLEKLVRWRHCHVPTSEDHPHPLAFMNLMGDAFHNFIDGLLIGGSFLVDIKLGIATSVAVVIHEIPQEIGDFGILIYAGLTRAKALLLNFAIALTAGLGVLVALVFGSYLDGFSEAIIPLTAGGFIYIAGADLIPELHKECHPCHSLGQLLALIGGGATMMLMLLLE